MGLDMYLHAESYVSGWKSQLTPIPTPVGSGLQVFKVSGEPDIDTPAYPVLLEASGIADLATSESPSVTVSVPCAYWRKANAIHHWFVENVQDGRDECQGSYVSSEQLTELRDLAAKALAAYQAGQPDLASQYLPPESGFFFGSTDVDEYYAGDLENRHATDQGPRPPTGIRVGLLLPSELVTMSEQVKVTIPESLMKAIEFVCQSDMQPAQRLEAVVLICHGYGLWQQHEGQFDPMSYAVPDRQWTQIAEWLQGTGRTITDGDAPPPLTREQNDAISTVNLALEFMNIGPSGYKEAA